MKEHKNQHYNNIHYNKDKRIMKINDDLLINKYIQLDFFCFNIKIKFN